MKILFLLFGLFLFWLGGRVGGARAERVDTTPVAHFDLPRYRGTWYEIARFDHRFERNLTQVEAHYTLLDNGRVRVVNSGVDSRTGERKIAIGKAHTTDDVGRLRVSFFLFFYGDYRVLALDPAYQWALVGSRGSRYLWILARAPTLPLETLRTILREADRRGFDTSKLRYDNPMPLDSKQP